MAVTARAGRAAARQGRHLLAVVSLLVVGTLLPAPVPALDGGAPHAASGGHGECHGEWVRLAPDAPPACAHTDAPPPGVDVTEPVTTSEALAREGAFEAVHEAAAELGAPTAVTPAEAVSVPCDGDGTSGYRTQAMYVVEVGRPNRYEDLLPTLRGWVAGVDAVVNRSAALTGGVRNVRFVHEPGTTDCRPVVLNVTVPSGALATFQASISALQAQGYADPTRKYLMWTDTTVLCGVASMYVDDQPGQDNLNNGRYAQYARTDAGCWGRSDHSTEAHELVHTLGAVQRTAPHRSAAGHCTDEHDLMCYRDGAVTMTYPCPPENEPLLDCGSDDYFSTYPVAGSYLDTRWNAADSRFLIGGGDGVDGGQAGLPTRLGVSVQVNSPGVPGLPTQATATLQLPEGRTAGVQWRASRADCALGSPTGLQTTITCPAASTAPVTLSVLATDSTGQTATATTPVTFSAPAGRAVSVAADVAGDLGTHRGCAGAPALVSGTVVDVASGLPVLGVTVELRRRTATTLPVTVGTGATRADGAHTLRTTVLDGQLYAARSRAVGPYQAAESTGEVLVRTEACTAGVTLQAAETSAWGGDTVRFSGTAVRTTAAGVSTPIANGSVSLLQVQPGATAPKVIAAVRTDASGSWAASPVLLASGPVTARLAAGPGNPVAVSAPVPLTVAPAATRLTGSATPLLTHYRSPVTVSGTLQRDEGGDTTPLAARRLQVTVTRPGTSTPLVLGSATTTADGAWSVTVAPTVGGTLAVAYAAQPGQPAARTVLGDLDVRSWTTGTTMTTATTSIVQGATVAVTGRVLRTGDGAAQAAPGVPVKVYLEPAAGGPALLVGSGTTRTDGTYAVSARPTQNGTLQARVVGVAGYLDSASTTAPVTVSARVSATASTRYPRVGTAFTVRTSVTVAQVATVRLEQSVAGGAWAQVQSTTTGSTGTAAFAVTRSATGPVSYRVRMDTTTRNAAASSPVVTVTVGP